MNARIAVALLALTLTAQATPTPEPAAQALTLLANIPPPLAAAALFGQYQEGYVIPQHEIRADRYRGWVYPAHLFVPFYLVERKPIHQLPTTIACCALNIAQVAAGSVDVVHVYARTGYTAATVPGAPLAGLIGPIESLVATDDGVMLLTAPYLGRRPRRVAP